MKAKTYQTFSIGQKITIDDGAWEYEVVGSTATECDLKVIHAPDMHTGYMLGRISTYRWANLRQEFVISDGLERILEKL